MILVCDDIAKIIKTISQETDQNLGLQTSNGSATKIIQKHTAKVHGMMQELAPGESVIEHTRPAKRV
jgi:hypothetical protein